MFQVKIHTHHVFLLCLASFLCLEVLKQPMPGPQIRMMDCDCGGLDHLVCIPGVSPKVQWKPLECVLHGVTTEWMDCCFRRALEPIFFWLAHTGNSSQSSPITAVLVLSNHCNPGGWNPLICKAPISSFEIGYLDFKFCQQVWSQIKFVVQISKFESKIELVTTSACDNLFRLSSQN